MTAFDVLVVSATDRERALAGGWAGIAALPACETCSGTPNAPCPEPGCSGCGRPRPCPDCTDGTRTPERVAIVAPCEACDGEPRDLRCARCRASASLPLGMDCADHRPMRWCPECEGGGMLLYGLAEVTGPPMPIRRYDDWPAWDLPRVVIDYSGDGCGAQHYAAYGYDNSGRDLGQPDLHIEVADCLGEFAPGGVALHLAAARLVTDPGGCPACEGDYRAKGWPDCVLAECINKGEGRFLPAPWAAPGLPSTPGLHRWEGA